MVLTVPKIVFQVLSVVFKDIVVLILYLPAGAGRQQPHILFGDRFVRYPAVFGDDLLLFHVIRFKTQVIYPQFPPSARFSMSFTH